MTSQFTRLTANRLAIRAADSANKATAMVGSPLASAQWMKGQVKPSASAITGPR
ncbi:hypothetical protein D3C84_1120430 [compost metagenome]